ncbi:Crp/Fnr family transcriptional regulator [Listeria rocourtiae]|uniref:Crp/Fnr family transcriptional regulator n=1 Tax=Listeria rocourtiae TaxID=647910 RepID=UPI003D2F8443
MITGQQMEEMHFLYNTETVTKEFNKQQLHYFLQKDMLFPIEGTVKKFEKHEFLIKEKDVIDDIYIIQSGHVMAMRSSSWVSDFYKETDIIGFNGLLLQNFADYSFKVISDEVITIKYKKTEVVEKVLNTQEGYLYHYVHMKSQVRRLLAKEKLLRLPSEERIGFALLQIINRYRDRTVYVGLIPLPKDINKGILAMYTNLNPNTVTTVLQAFRDESIIRVIQQTMHIDVWKLKAKLE